MFTGNIAHNLSFCLTLVEFVATWTLLSVLKAVGIVASRVLGAYFVS
jgi:hypothetical protein